MWTISDFPGLGTLSGWNTYTGLAYPSCNNDSNSCHLPFSRKWCFMGHRHFLESRYRFRLNRVQFDGNTKLRNPPIFLSGTEILKQVENIDVIFGKGERCEVRGKRFRNNRVEESDSQ